MTIRGALERKDAEAIQGWLLVEGASGSPQSLEVLIDGEVIARLVADRPRPDVRLAGFGDGACGFEFRFPPDIDPAKAAAAQVRLLDTELYLIAKETRKPEAKPAAGAGSVFILGPARSGTSITFLALQQVLGLSGLGEGHVLKIFQRVLYACYLYVVEFADDPGILAGRIDIDTLKAGMIPIIQRFYFDQFGGEPFVDKTPGLEALVGAPFINEVFPAAKVIVMNRNGIEVVESYRRKFKASFESACREWADCAREIEKLRKTQPSFLFLDQNEMRASPESVAMKIGVYLGRPDKISELSTFLRANRSDVLSDAHAWDAPLTLETVDWTEEEKRIFAANACAE